MCVTQYFVNVVRIWWKLLLYSLFCVGGCLYGNLSTQFIPVFFFSFILTFLIPCPASMSFQVVVKISYLLLQRLLSPKFLGRESCIYYLLAEGPGVARGKIETKIKKYFRFFKHITPPDHSWVSTKNVSPIGPAICPWKKFKIFYSL